MAVYFAPERKDPNADLKYYMLQMAQLLGGKRRETKDIRDIAQYGQYQQQLSEAETLKQSLMAMTPEQVQQYQGRSPQWPPFREAPQMRTAVGVQELARRLDPLYQARVKDYERRGVAKPAKRVKADVLLEQIDKKVAAGTLKEGSAEHLRLLGARGDKIQTPEDRLKFWQTVLQKTKDAIGSTFEGQESTAKLAADKIEEAKKQIRKGIIPVPDPDELKTLDEDEAIKILKEVAGDKKKAREIARQRGFTF